MRGPLSSLPKHLHHHQLVEAPESSLDSPRGSLKNYDWYSDALSSEASGNEIGALPDEHPLHREDPCVLGREEAALVERWAHENEAEVLRCWSREFLEEKRKSIGLASELMNLTRAVKECLLRISARIVEDEEPDGISVQGTPKSSTAEPEMIIVSETKYLQDILLRVEAKLAESSERRKREVEDMETSVSSLTEENRDLASLLREAILEKEAMERNLAKLKKSAAGEHKGMAILQLAGRGLQKVGFGFFMDSSDDDSAANEQLECGSRSEEANRLADTVDNMLKNLRREIAELRHSLKESRSDSEHLRNLTDKQTTHIKESTHLIEELKERENMMSQIVEDLRVELSLAREEISRWREACEMEVEAGNFAIGEIEREAAVLREDLERTRIALETANKKLELKEKLAATAAAAQEAAEISLQLADSRSVELRERVEELTRKLEEDAERNRRALARQKIRYICWPWRAPNINFTASNGRSRNYRRMPEMLAILP